MLNKNICLSDFVFLIVFSRQIFIFHTPETLEPRGILMFYWDKRKGALAYYRSTTLVS